MASKPPPERGARVGTEAESSARPPAADAAVFLGTFALILLAMVALFTFDLFLAGLERAERRSEARHFYAEGVRLAQQGRRKEAVDRFQSAVSAERGNPVYQRGLAAALLDTGGLSEATTVLAARLQEEPADAAASLLMARLLDRERKRADAVSYYHRAIYGHWDENAARNRVQARFELVDLLARMGAQRELLSELLPLEREAASDLATRRRIAHLFIEAGAPSHAVAIFRELLRKHGRDAETLAGLGAAELARGNYRSARAYLTEAAESAPADSSIAQRLELARRVIALDPTQRGLGAEEQYRRSVVLLGLTVSAAESCWGRGQDTTRVTRLAIDSARAMLVQRMPTVRRHEAIDRNLDWAERLWDSRPQHCPGLPSEEAEPVRRVLDRVEQ
jgi:tetratricopeptide (TPR) repeat protein